MTLSYSFFIETKPIAKGRSRSAYVNGRTIHYTPKETVQFEKLVAKEGKKVFDKPLEQALFMAVEYVFELPKTLPKYMIEHMNSVAHTIKPDTSNLVKAVEDGLNTVAYLDDSQIVETYVTKSWGESNGIRITIQALTDQITYKVYDPKTKKYRFRKKDEFITEVAKLNELSNQCRNTKRDKPDYR